MLSVGLVRFVSFFFFGIVDLVVFDQTVDLEGL